MEEAHQRREEEHHAQDPQAWNLQQGLEIAQQENDAYADHGQGDEESSPPESPSQKHGPTVDE
jgi:hypothetical protein